MIDVQVSTGTDVPMTITPDSVRKPVAEAILTFMLALAKKLPVKVGLVCDARWDLKAQASGLDRIDLGNVAYYMFGLLRPFVI